jgi:beta-lactamase class D
LIRAAVPVIPQKLYLDMKRVFILLLFLTGNIANTHSAKNPGRIINRVVADSIAPFKFDLKKYYDQFKVDGTFVLLTPGKKCLLYNKKLYNQPATPASTFNIVTTLISLEERKIKDGNSLFPWKGNKNDTVSYHRNMTLSTAFALNMEWPFRGLCLKEGPLKMKRWLDIMKYGNADVSGSDEGFWAGSTLKITPAQQLKFIREFYYEQFPFSKRTYRITKRLMLEKDSAGIKVYGHRGSYLVNDKYLGWFVGYVETKSGVYFFTNYIESPNLKNKKLVDAQKEIVFKILKRLNLAG